MPACDVSARALDLIGLPLRVVDDSKHHLAQTASIEAPLECLSRFGEWVGLVHQHLKLALVSETGKLVELIAIGLHNKEGAVDAVICACGVRRFLCHGYQSSTRLEDRQGVDKTVSPNGVKHQVDRSDS